MCELLAMSSAAPVTINLSLRAFAEHGGATGPHDDGWGIAYYHGAYARIIKDVRQAAGSDWVAFVEGRNLHSTTIIAHIRHGTRGGIALENTHPFARELGGRVHVFAHNGTLRGYETDARFRLGSFCPIGETDSEWAFCLLLARLRDEWTNGGAPPPLERRLAVVAQFAREVRELGAANFLYCDSEYLFAHATARTHDDGRFEPPGLNLLERRAEDPTAPVDGGGVHLEPATRSPDHAMVLLASVPLTDEPWAPLGENELVVLADGRIVTRVAA